MSRIRNFCIIAHIDHGKSTLADRFLEITETVEKREMKHGQHLDTMELEQERGITIKLQPVRMNYKEHQLNLIDTPGHADFQYEVSRSLKAVEGAILIVDATQGIEAQTLANIYLAMEQNLSIIPVINKIDLPAADPERIKTEIENVLSIPAEEIIEISAKEGTNCEKVLEAIIEKVPAPQEVNSPPDKGEPEGLSAEASAQAGVKSLIFDSVFDTYRGVVIYVRNFSGNIKRGDKLKLLRANTEFEALEVGCFKPKYSPTPEIKAGEIGYIITGLKSVRDARVGETVWKKISGGRSQVSENKTNTNTQHPTPLPGYKKVTPFVFAGVFATDADDYPLLRDALEKLSLNDASLTYEPESSTALGFGFRCGFLGLLHMEIVQERLEREYNLDLIVTAPSVKYEVVSKDKTVHQISNPSELPSADKYEELREPWVHVEIVTPKEYMGGVLELVTSRRGIQKNLSFLDPERSLITYELPLASIVTDFYDKLKNVSSGYASLNYEHLDFRAGDLVRLDVLVAGEQIDALSFIVHKSESRSVGLQLCKKLKEIIPRANFVIPIQAAIGAQIIARETLSAFRKDVTEKLYGGDVTRKNKLLKKQKAGKKRMKQFGKVTLPQEAFLAVLKRD